MKKFTMRITLEEDLLLDELINNIDSPYYGMSMNGALQKMIIDNSIKTFGKERTKELICGL